MDGDQIYRAFEASRGAEGLLDAREHLKKATAQYQEFAGRIQGEASSFEEYWSGDAAGAAQRGLGPAAVEATSAAEQSTTAEDLLRRQAESYDYAKRNVRPVPPMPTNPPSLAEVVANPGAGNSYFARAQASQDAARNNVEQANVFQTASDYNGQMMPASFGSIDAGKFDINTSTDSSSGRGGVGGVGGAVPAVGGAVVPSGSSGAGGRAAGTSTSGVGSATASKAGSGAGGSAMTSTRQSGTAPAASSGQVPGTTPPTVDRSDRPGTSSRLPGGTAAPFGGSTGGVRPGVPGGTGGPRGSAPGVGGSPRGGLPGGQAGGGQPGGRMSGQLPGGVGQAGGAGRAGLAGGRAGIGPGMTGGPGAGRGKGDDDREHKNKFAQPEQLDDGLPREQDEYGERTIDEASGHTVVPPVIGDNEPEQTQNPVEPKAPTGAAPSARAAAGSANPYIPPSAEQPPKQT